MNARQFLGGSLTLFASLAALAAGATTQRTFVASDGDDANGCSRVAPCRGFARALTQTSPNGEIIVLDSAGYGTVAIDRAVTITAPAGIYAGITVSAGAGITLGTAGAVVTLRGLTINGQGGTTGILFTGGGPLTVERSVISNINGPGIDARAGTTMILRDVVVSANDDGIVADNAVIETHRVSVERNANAGLRLGGATWLMLKDGSVTANGGSGIYAVVSASKPGGAQVTIDSSFVADNGIHGAHVDLSGGASNFVRLQIMRSSIVRNQAHGLFASGAGAYVYVVSDDNVINGNGSAGVAALGEAAMVLSQTRIMNNSIGVQRVAGNNVRTHGNNSIIFNLVDLPDLLIPYGGD